MDLPVELRLIIYRFLLPPNTLPKSETQSGLDLAILRTSRQIFQEAKDLLKKFAIGDLSINRAKFTSKAFPPTDELAFYSPSNIRTTLDTQWPAHQWIKSFPDALHHNVMLLKDTEVDSLHLNLSPRLLISCLDSKDTLISVVSALLEPLTQIRLKHISFCVRPEPLNGPRARRDPSHPACVDKSLLLSLTDVESAVFSEVSQRIANVVEGDSPIVAPPPKLGLGAYDFLHFRIHLVEHDMSTGLAHFKSSTQRCHCKLATKTEVALGHWETVIDMMLEALQPEYFQWEVWNADKKKRIEAISEVILELRASE